MRFMKKKPTVIVYSRDNSKFGMDLEKMLESLVSKLDVVICRTTQGLMAELRMPLSESAIAVLHIADEKDLKDTLSIKPLLLNMRIVLILPDRNDATIEAGHSLHPRYLSYKDNSLNDIKTVLTRMIEVEKATYKEAQKQILSLRVQKIF
jgi:hypothetical protein